MLKGQKISEQGRSMIEMIGVLAIVAVLSVGGLKGYNYAMRRIKIQKFMDEFGLVLSQAHENFLNMDRVDITTATVLVQETSNLEKALKALSDASYFSAPRIYRFTSPYDFYFYFYKIPKDLCLEMVKYDYSGVTCFSGLAGSWKTRIPSQSALDYCNQVTTTAEVNLLFNVQPGNYCNIDE